MKKKLTLGTVFAAIVASAILAAPGGAAKPIFSVACTSSSITLTWPSGTTGVNYATWSGFDGTGNQVAVGNQPISPNGPGSVTIDLSGASGPSVSATATFTNRKTGARLAPVNCTA
jgi:hypothetical protein